MGRARLGKTGRHTLIGGHIHLAEHAADFGSNGFAFFLVKIEDGDLDTLCSQSAGGTLAQTRSATRNHCCNRTIEFHQNVPIYKSEPSALLRI